MKFFKTSQTSVSGVRLPGLVTSSDGARTGDDGPPLSDQSAAAKAVPVPHLVEVASSVPWLPTSLRLTVPLLELNAVSIERVRAVVEIVRDEVVLCNCNGARCSCAWGKSHDRILAAVESLLDGVEA